MKKISLFAVFLLLALPISTYALPFTFGPISDEGGTGTATMDIEIVGSTLTATIDNTSPVDLDGESSGGNSPGITGFGVNLDPDTLSLDSSDPWDLMAYTADGTPVSVRDDWVMNIDTSSGNIFLDYFPTTNGGIDGALYNPLAFSDPNNTLPGGSNDVYYTTAVLVMTFNPDGGPPTINTEDDYSPFVRMQNVGALGEGSLKLSSVPDASVMLLLGSSLMGLAVFSRKSKKS